MTASAEPGLPRPGLFRSVANWWGPRPLTQVLLLIGTIAIFAWFGTNTVASMAKSGINPGFGFLGNSAKFEIGETLIPYSSSDTYARAILVGLLNTIKVALLGCVLATILGVALGVARLSGNLLLANLVRWYVEIIRNTPLLLQLFFWSAVTHAFPPPRQALSAFGAVFLSTRGIFIPGVIIEQVSLATWLVLAALLVLAVLALVLLRRRHYLSLGRAILVLVGWLVLSIVALLVTGSSARFELPALGGFNIRGGWSLTPEFAALLVGLTVKFSAAIAEIVRAGIQSVNAGQWDAARALGLKNGQIMRKIVLPQALRVITPLITSSYLDLTKDSSLAVAIGYPDLVNVINTTANTTGQALEALAILIGIYLALNLSVSAAMNQYNRRVAMRGMVSL